MIGVKLYLYLQELESLSWHLMRSQVKGVALLPEPHAVGVMTRSVAVTQFKIEMVVWKVNITWVVHF